MKQLIQGMPKGVTLIRYLHPTVAHASYLLVDALSGTAAVVDPYRDVDPYLEDAWRLSAKVKHVFLTQIHEDFSQGFAEIRDRCCATVYAGAWASSNPGWMLLKDGDAFEFGRVRIRILETPGHRLEAIVLVLHDLDTPDAVPYAALTGETVILGDIGRPMPRPEDGYGIEDLASMLYDSLTQKILHLPDSLRLFPAHPGAAGPSVMLLDTLRAQRQSNPGLQPMTREDFVHRVSLGMALAPPSQNGTEIHLPGASLNEVLRAQRAGAQLVDDRDPVDFAAAHLAGSINLPLTADLDGWSPGVLDWERPIVILSGTGHESAFARRLSKLGFTRVMSYLEGGVEQLEARPDLVRVLERISYPDLGAKLTSDRPFLLLDTREGRQERKGPALCAYPVPLRILRSQTRCLPQRPEIIVCDDTPYRASAAASFLLTQGFSRVSVVAGGLALWGRFHR